LNQPFDTSTQITKGKKFLRRKAPSNLSHKQILNVILGSKTPEQTILPQDLNTQQITQTNDGIKITKLSSIQKE